MKFEELITNHIGEWGRYQHIQLFLVCLPTMFTAMHALSWPFAAADSLHRCRLPNEVGPVSFRLPAGESRVKLMSDCHDASGTACPYQPCTFSNGTACTNGYVYDRSVMSYSALQRWDIVCDNKKMKADVQSAYYWGQLLGSVVCGMLGDRIGRKKVFVMSLGIQIVAGFGMAIAPHWIVFALFRVAVGFAHPGIFVIAVVIGMELVGPTKRKVASVFSGIFFSIGQIILGILALVIRDYRYLQLAIAAPTVVFLSYWWLVPESARWLCSQRRYEDADKVMRVAAKRNGTTVPEKWWEDLEDTLSENTKESAKKFGYLDLLRTPKIRKISIAIFFCWPIVSMIYYGMSMKTDILGGSLYLNFIFGAAMEIPAVLTVFLLIDRLGRKVVLAAGFIISSLCMLSNLLVGDEGSFLDFPFSVLVHWLISIAQFLLAKGIITGTYAAIYTFTPELFPTVIRNTAMGICSMMARLGAIAASYISLYVAENYGKIYMIVPFGVLGICAGLIIIFFLPETAGKKLPETVDEIEGHRADAEAHELEPLSKPEESKVTSDPTVSEEK